MTGRAGSATSIFLFVYLRSLKNSVRRLLRRLREPRYLIGFALGIIYFSWIFGRNRYGQPPPRAATLGSLPPEALSLALLLASAVLAAILLGSWILKRGRADLSLSEAEAQFFFSAPLSTRAVTHYALIRPQASLLLSSLVLVFVLRRGDLASRIPVVLGTWIALSTVRLHWLGIAFARASWSERGRTMRDRFATLAAAALLAILLVSFFDALRGGAAWLLDSSHSLDALERAVSSRRLAGLSGLLVLPARALLSPLFAPSLPEFLLRLLAAVGILGVHYVWVLRAASGYEEATLEGAVRRAQRRERRLAGRMNASPAPRRRRGIVPFALAPRGRPEVAILWKNLIHWQRVRLSRLGIGVAVVCLGLFALFYWLPSAGLPALGMPAAATVFGITGVIALALPVASRYDLREDLEYLSVIRAWPLSSERLVAAELASTWVLSIGFLLIGTALAGAIAAGSLSRAAPSDTSPGAVLLTVAPPFLLAALFLVPAVAAFVVLVQNGLTLSFPAWFHQTQRRVTNLERSGSMMVTMLVTLFVLAVAALPCALITAILWGLLGPTLGIWLAPLAALLSSVPLWTAVFLAIKFLATLYEGFDPSDDLVA